MIGGESGQNHAAIAGAEQAGADYIYSWRVIQEGPAHHGPCRQASVSDFDVSIYRWGFGNRRNMLFKLQATKGLVFQKG